MRTRTRQPSSKRQEQLAKVAAIRAHVGPVASRFTDNQLVKLVYICGSVGIACDALTMIPQPKFLRSL